MHLPLHRQLPRDLYCVCMSWVFMVQREKKVDLQFKPEHPRQAVGWLWTTIKFNSIESCIQLMDTLCGSCYMGGQPYMTMSFQAFTSLLAYFKSCVVPSNMTYLIAAFHGRLKNFPFFGFTKTITEDLIYVSQLHAFIDNGRMCLSTKITNL